jgi:glycosyltransferase involved in cell wall biosynthesis
VLAEFGASGRVVVLKLAQNGGVGKAVKAGFERALDLNAEFIVKLDADGQMDPANIPGMIAVLTEDRSVAYVKGNRFFRADVMRKMPRIRLIGNSILSLLVKFSSGYWNILDPTNGYFAFNAKALRRLEWRLFADRYYFEISILCTLGLHRAPIAEVEMAAIYAGEQSSLSIARVLWDFPRRLLAQFLQRVLLQYFIFDVNLGTLYLLFGFLLALAGVVLGAYEWAETIATQVPRATGSVMLVVVMLLIGFQLLLNALMYDVQFGPKSVRKFIQ